MAIADLPARLSRFWAFSDLGPDDLGKLAAFVEERAAVVGTVLYRQGDAPAFFFLVEQGQVLERGQDAAGATILRRRADPGDCFGHRPLIDGVPHPTTATVSRDARLLTIRADRFRTVLAVFPNLSKRLQRTQVANRLMAIPLFGDFSADQLRYAADLVREVQFAAGATIFREGDHADALYVVDVGQVVERAAGIPQGTQTWPKYITAGGCFGRYSLQRGTPRRATAEAVSDVRLFRLESDAFGWLRQLQPRFDDALRRPDVLHHMRQTSIFAKLNDEELKHLAGYVGLVHCRPGDVLYRQGEIDPTLYVLYEGEAIVRGTDEAGSERPRGYLRAGMFVGETSLFLREPRDVTVESTTHTNWFYLTAQDLVQYLAQRPEVRDKLTLGTKVTRKQRLKRFSWMDADETMVLRARRHWFALAYRLAPPVLILVVLLLLLPVPIVNLLAAFLLALDGLWLAWQVVDWWNDYYVVTTKRVAHREKVLLVRERRDETPLDKITNVNTDRRLLGNLFGFGTLFVDTAATVGVARVMFNYLGDPDGVKNLVFEQMSRVRAGERLEARRSIRDKLAATVGAGPRPTVPKPVVPAAPVPAAPPARQQPRLSVRTAFKDLGFWIEDRSADRVVWRKHWIRLLAKIWIPALVLVADLVVLALLIAAIGELAVLVVGLLVLVLLAAAFWLWWGWTDWGNDQYIVTNDRIIDVEQKPLGFRSKRTETTFDKVQNVSFDIPNPIATILDWGTVMIHTAGVQGRLDFLYVRDPKRVQSEVFQRLNAYQAAQRRQQREEQWAELPEWFAAFDERLRRQS